MKKILFLLLFPCLALAQYQGNANQKITLGEQTTADGLVFRGVASIDTVTATSKITRANKQDTSAFLLLDTTTNLLWHYKTGSNAWTQAGGSTFDTTTLNLTSRFNTKLNISDTLNMLVPYLRKADTTNMLLPYFRDADTTTLNLTSRLAAKQNNITLTTTGTSGAATLTGATLNIPQYSSGGGITDGDKGDIDVTNSGATWTIDTSAVSLSGNKVTGTLPVANGGTNTNTLTANKVMVGNGTSGVLTPTNLHWDNTNSRLGIGTSSPEYYVHLKNPQPIQLFMEGTSTTTHAAMYFTNSRSTTFTSYGGFLYGGTSQTDALFGLNRNDKLFLFADGSNNLGMIVGTLSNQPLYFGTNNTERMRMTSDGELWIGYTTDGARGTYPLQVNGQLFATSSTVATPSDKKYKENITPLTKGLEIVNKLKPVTFNFITDTENNFSEYEEVGFIAQDVDRALSTETFAKSIVKQTDDSDPNSTYLIGTGNLIPILTKAIQEQQALIKALEQRILILENK